MDERHTAAAAAIIEGKSVEDAATAAHRGDPKTIYRWAEEPEFLAKWAATEDVEDLRALLLTGELRGHARCADA